jgi:hypothetical protein
MTTTVGRIYYIFLGIYDGLESYMQFVISCDGFVSIDIPMNLTVDRLLFGLPDLTDDQNNSLFLNVQKFIINSKRFI